MGSGGSQGSALTNLRIGSKIGVGFTLVLLILAVSFTVAWLAFGRVAAAVGEYATLATNSEVFRDIERTVTQYRGQVREYVYSDHEDIAQTVLQDAAALHGLITKASHASPIRNSIGCWNRSRNRPAPTPPAFSASTRCMWNRRSWRLMCWMPSS
jgi:hypothetical protein